MEFRHLPTTLVLASCLLLASCVAAAPAKAAQTSQKEGGREIKVKLEDCPRAVQDTLRKEAAGATITQVDNETESGKTTYETDVVIGGKNYEIKVAEDGTLISRKLDEEGDNEQNGEHEDKK